MAEPLASLPMYDWPETREPLERLWLLLREELSKRSVTSPLVLGSPDDLLDHWHSPNLLLSQTCGWPYANHLRGSVIPFARVDFHLRDCPSGYYRSVFIGNQSDDTKWLASLQSLADCPKIAVNSLDSQSGFHVFSEMFDENTETLLPMDKLLITGAHRDSLVAVAKGDANIAAIDAVAFELAREHENAAFENVHIIGYSQPRPGLPLITSVKNREIIPALFEAFAAAIGSLDPADRSALHMHAVSPAIDADYDVFLSSRNG